LTVALLVIPRQAGLASDFSLATSAISSATWTFGDNSSAVTTSGSSVSHVYTAGGTYTAGVTVTDAFGQTASTTSTVTIQGVTPPPAPLPVFTATVACTTSAGRNIACNATAMSNGVLVPSATVHVDWDWGDSTKNSCGCATGTHTYLNAGTYMIYAIVSGPVNQNLQITQTTVSVTVQ
jgi:PKD repeat protein